MQTKRHDIGQRLTEIHKDVPGRAGSDKEGSAWKFETKIMYCMEPIMVEMTDMDLNDIERKMDWK